MDEKDRLTPQDLVDAGVCGSGIRKWFSQRGDDLPPGITFRSFMKHGMTLEEARSLNDGVVNHVLAMKERSR